MSEEILKGLMQLFAIISKRNKLNSEKERDYVLLFLQSQLQEKDIAEYLNYFDRFLVKNNEKLDGLSAEKQEKLKVKDFVRTIGICKKVNRTLTSKQKVIVLMRLFEMVKESKNDEEGVINIIVTAGEIFKIPENIVHTISAFIFEKSPNPSPSYLLKIGKENTALDKEIYLKLDNLEGEIQILRLEDFGLYFLKYNGCQNVTLNDYPLQCNRVSLFPKGSKLKINSGTSLYYSDIVSKYAEDQEGFQLSFIAENISHTFPNKTIGLHKMTLAEKAGQLVGIMGASGTGKTTLMNVLSGLTKPTSGSIQINGIDIHQADKHIDGVIGFVPQDDLLIEELTVYQNLYFNAKLCLGNLSDAEIEQKVHKILENLGLFDARNLKVGSPLKKSISGGERKRLNIGLELIREPSILFVDEPTSGLSSSDSENVMELLSKMTARGNLIFAVIHQPSGLIYRMFDKMIFLDTGGFLVYYGNPVEALRYFKKADNQINTNIDEHINPEIIFKIIESKVIDEYGYYTDRRKVSAQEWHQKFLDYHETPKVKTISEKPPGKIHRPNVFKQFLIFIQRDILSKITNKQYLLINILETPVLAFFLSYLIKYIEDPNQKVYVYRENDNMAAYLIMCVVVALFVGLTVSAEEIHRDKKILQREKFLNLNRGAYLFSKISILFFVSAIQALTLVFIGNSILEIKDMFLPYWWVLFSLFCFSNIMGLIVSQSLNSAVAIYILIPLLIIPQMILGGAIFSYEKINRTLGGGYKVPFIAETMPSRWAFEALMVHQFKNNKYQQPLFELERKESSYDFKVSYWIPMLRRINNESKNMLLDSSKKVLLNNNITLLKHELMTELEMNHKALFYLLEGYDIAEYDETAAIVIGDFLKNLDGLYNKKLKAIYKKRDAYFSEVQKTKAQVAAYRSLRDNYYNENIASFVKNRMARHKAFVVDNKVVQVVDPIYKLPNKPDGLQLKYHFYTPYKYLMKRKMETLNFNVMMIWMLTLILFIFLYLDVIRNASLLFKRIFVIGKQ